MKQYASLKKQNRSRLLTVAALAMCVLLSGTVMFSRLMVYTPGDHCQYIPLTQSNGITRVVTQSGRAAGTPAPTGRLLAANPGFQTADENTVWQGETAVEIFRINYENGQGQVTVQSAGGDKVLAPGTGGTYEFALQNTGNVSLDYTLSMEAWFSDSQTPIPIYARVTDHLGNYLVGAEEEMVDVLRLNEVDEAGVLAAGNVAPCTLEWEWPFELDDEYDTMLGNLAVDRDITLTIVIRTTACWNGDPNAPGGVPPTGDTGAVGMWFAVMVCSMAAIPLVLLLRRKDEENADEKA